MIAQRLSNVAQRLSNVAERLSNTAMRRSTFALLAALCLIALACVNAGSVAASVRVRDLTAREGDVPRRLVGYGLVVGLDGTGDRSFGGTSSGTPTVHTVVNLLRRFQIEVPNERLRLRNVAAVLVTAEVSPYLRTGGRFEVQVSALGDATSLRGGVLWMTPLVTDPDQPPVATAQGALLLGNIEQSRAFSVTRGGMNSGRIPDGGVVEVDPATLAMVPHLILRDPDLGTAIRIAAAVDTAFGAGTARVDDAGRITLTPRGAALQFLAAVDTLEVVTSPRARIVLSAREGTVVAGGSVEVGPAVISHHGITLEIGGSATAGTATGLVHVPARASVLDVAAGLHAAGARPEEIAAIFESLRAAGAIQAEVVVR